MNLNFDMSKYMIPILGAACIGGGALVVSGARTPAPIEEADPEDAAEARVPNDLVLDQFIPTMEQVVGKHLFVPEREATGENAYPDLLVKGVYVGETERNAVFSLKSKPEANLRVWQGDEDAALAQVIDERDPRQPIVNFLGEWHIQSIDFAGVTLEHVITGEVETYAVDYKPLKHAKASSQNGFGQGYLVDASAGAARTSTAKPASSGQPQARAPAGGSTTAIAGRVGQYMERLSPQQRQQFMQQLQKQNAASAKKGGGGASQSNQKKSSSSNNSKKSSGRTRR